MRTVKHIYYPRDIGSPIHGSAISFQILMIGLATNYHRHAGTAPERRRIAPSKYPNTSSCLLNTPESFTVRAPYIEIKLLTKFATIAQGLPRHFLCRRLAWIAVFHSVSRQKLKVLPKNLPHRPLREDQTKQITQIMRPRRHHPS